MSHEWDRPMTDVDHAPPDDARGTVDAFRRGPRTIAVDGGRREGADDRGREPRDADRSSTAEPATDDGAEVDERTATPDDGAPTMRDVSHTPPTGDGANRVFDRGSAERGASTESADAGDEDEDGRA